ncbi:lytic polysaccharide monooxygenase [Aaosphaeria arxii CBS 175.79]|uniref:AA9 family lytic polysaccharide monooxygenase n=1 Tax=Aaosphaeria arxii CBS 175.79 TaxID=1450172 RepID=A0A6A5XN14_9PLEO|nr:lytic polysaccharide monooxygenase [Aaosphaeria arxii CBS 175.79]KAF2014306.1 lytic polysaccharide monooxygenase [Aaosphaeria arxii CBS 175.79]
MHFQTAALALIASSLPGVSAHYFFDKLVVNGEASSTYVRANTRAEKYMPTKFINTFDNLTPLSTDFRCNLGATNKAAQDTANVKAGDSLAMVLGVGATMKHPGPAQVYMSKAPSTVAAYEGDGEWFKIHQETICNPDGDIRTDAWCTWDKDRVSFEIPAGIEDGEYLVRTEHIGLHGAHAGEAEFYYACAQVSVSGGGSLVPKDTVKIPGVYAQSDPEVNFSIWGTNKAYPEQGPGPVVFSGSLAPDTTPTNENTPSSTPTSESTPSSTPTSTPTGETAPINESTPTTPTNGQHSCRAPTRRHARDMKV